MVHYALWPIPQTTKNLLSIALSDQGPLRMLDAVHVSNFRSFQNPTVLEIRPITILLGRNSSGKSTLTRLFPLMQQSIESRNQTPVLWASDDVDFGSVGDVLSHNAIDKEIEIGFRISGSEYSRNPLRHRYLGPNFPLPDITYSAFLTAIDGRTSLKRLVIQISDQTIVVRLADYGSYVESITIDNEVSRRDSSVNYEIYADKSSLFPDLIRLSSSDDEGSGLSGRVFNPELKDALEFFVHRKTATHKKDFLIRRATYVPPEDVGNYVRTLPNVVESRTHDPETLRRLSNALLINELPRLIKYVEQTLTPIFQRVAYLGPARARGDRFYRVRELSVKSIDARGDNLPIYLSTLSENDISSFNTLLDGACGYHVRVGKSGPGHVTIELGRPGSDQFENIADVGFGFTQLLPVVAQLHAGMASDDEFGFSPPLQGGGGVRSIVAIEQPELHLHPALQANLADLFLSAVQNSSELRLVVETHSETLIGRLGALVSSGAIKSEDVAVYFVEKDDEADFSRLRKESFDLDGFVTNWPVGFFSSDI